MRSRKKKSVEAAILRADALHNEYPFAEYRVMDRKNKRAVVTGSEWVYQERLREGYRVVYSTGKTKGANINA